MAADALGLAHGSLAALAPATMAALDAVLPATWSKGNPVDIVGDALPERYAAAMDALASDPGIDALLVLNAPTAIASSAAAARIVAEKAKGWSKPVLACWLGGATARAAERVFAAAGVASYPTPETAVRAFLHMAEHRANQALLMEAPTATPAPARPAEARAAIDAARTAGRAVRGEIEAKAVLAAYGIPVVPTRPAADAAEARAIARGLGFPVALKVRSPDIAHKTDVGGVALDLEDEGAVEREAGAMLARIARLRPGARIEGFAVQPMARRPGAVELIAGLARDPVFGPIVLVGHGGVAVEAIGDRAVGLPPLNPALARAMIARTRVARLLAGFRDRPPADLEAVALALVRLSEIAIDLPEVAELDINPLWADADGVLGLDARIRVAEPVPPAIRPYPKELEETVTVGTRRLVLRPIRPEDEAAHRRFLARFEPEDVRSRFFGYVRELPRSELARLTQIDYEREMAFVAIAEDGETLGVARAVCDPDGRRAEFAIVVRSDAKGGGLGTMLLGKLVRYLRERGVAEVVGQTLHENRAMQALARDLGFEAATSKEDPGIVELRLALGGPG
jgi:acetyltransferase